VAQFVLLLDRLLGEAGFRQKGRIALMSTEEGRSAGLLVMGLPLLAVAAATLMHALPLKITALLLAWTLFSLPLGIAIGHCALGEDRIDL